MSAVSFMTREQLLQKAENEGLVCIFPHADELQIDLDQGKPDINKDVLSVIASNGILVSSMLTTKSRTGGRHVYYQLNRPLEPIQRIALQACLGSDPVREVLSFLRGESWDFLDFVSGEAVWSMLFETPDQAAEVDLWRQNRNLF